MPVETRLPIGKISIPKTRGKAKIKIVEKRKMTQEMLERIDTEDLDVSVALIQALLPYGLKAVMDKLKYEVELLTGKRYAHGKGNLRWGKQPGSVYLREQKIPIVVPRVRDKQLNAEVPLETYRKLQQPYLSDRQTMLKLLNGISMRKYQECAELVPQIYPAGLRKTRPRCFRDSRPGNLRVMILSVSLSMANTMPKMDF